MTPTKKKLSALLIALGATFGSVVGLAATAGVSPAAGNVGGLLGGGGGEPIAGGVFADVGGLLGGGGGVGVR